MAYIEFNASSFQLFTSSVDQVISNLSDKAKKEDISGLQKLIDNFNLKTEDFFRKERKLNI